MFFFIIKPNVDAFILTAAGVIARIRTVTPVPLGVAKLNYTTPFPLPPPNHTYFLVICSSRVASFLMSDRVR